MNDLPADVVWGAPPPPQRQQAPPDMPADVVWDQAPAAVAPTGAEPPSQMEAAGRGFLKGVTSNFSDEIEGAAKASGSPEWDRGYNAIAGLARLAYEHMTGGRGPATEEYERARDELRARHKQIEEEHPGTFLAGQLAGAIALPGSAAAQAATMPARMARGAAVGAGYGAAAGFGEGEGFADSAGQAVVRAPVGAVVGAAAPPVVEGAAKAAAWATRPIRSAYSSLRDPDAIASKRVAAALERDAEIDPAATSRLTPQEFQTNVAQGGPARIVDLGGEMTRGMARSAANTSPEGRSVLNQAINERFEGQSGRLSNWLQHRFNFPDPHATQKALDEARSEVLNPLYRKSYKEGDKIPLWDDDLKGIVQAPEVQEAIGFAERRLRNWAVAEGLGRPVGTFEIVGGRATLRQTGAGNEYSPSLQLWDYTKQALDEMGKKSPTARMYAHDIRTKMDELVPSYQEARSTAAGFFGAGNALEAGENFVNSRLANDAARSALSDMSKVERQLFQDGFVSRLVKNIEETGDRRNVLNQIADSPAARERLNIALGPHNARALEATLRVEGIMDLARSAVHGSSTTARQLVELGLASGAYGYGELSGDPKSLIKAAMVYGAARGQRALSERISRRVAEMLVSNDPAVVRQGITIIARNRDILGRLRNADAALARIGAAQSPPMAPGSARADEMPQSPLSLPQEGSGDRSSPVQLETPDDVHYAAGGTVQPSPAQAKAGNYKKRHLQWKGLDIAIETERGGERAGMHPDGSTWSTVMQHPYGYIKGTTGRDDDQIDVYVGPRPHSQRVFVVDQADPDGGGKFDEHKVIIGAKDATEARAIYDTGFGDGSGPKRRAAVTEMSIPQLKVWLAEGDTARPVSPASGERSRWKSASKPVTLEELFDDPRSADEIRASRRPDFLPMEFADGGEVQ